MEGKRKQKKRVNPKEKESMNKTHWLETLPQTWQPHNSYNLDDPTVRCM